MAESDKVTVHLTKLEVGVLRRLIIEEARRLGYPYQHPSDEPAKLRRMNSVARKIWEARQHFDGTR
jgi:hypothetical protein